MIKVIKNLWINQNKGDKVLMMSLLLIILAMFILKLIGAIE